MALKYTIDKTAHAALPKDIQAEYSPKGESFVLAIEGDDSPANLLSAKQHEVDARKLAETALREAKTALQTLTDERDGMLKGSIPKSDVEKLENSYKTKLQARETELTGQIGQLTANIQTMLVDNVAADLAGKISTSPTLMLPHIKPRLKAELVDGKWVTKVVDADGKPSASTLSDLQKELVAKAEFAPILIGSKASGGGASGGGGGGGASTGGKIDMTKSPKEIAAAIKARGGLQE